MSAFLSADLCWLRPVSREDVPTITDWSHDREVTRHLFRGTFPTYAENALAAYEQMIAQPNEYEFAIMWRDPEKFVGVVGLHSIQWVARSAEFRILIGEKDYWGKGLGTEAAHLLTAYGFELLNLHKVWLGVNSANLGAVRSYEKAGFVNEGVLRHEVYRNGEYHDVTRMSMLREEYLAAKDTWTILPHLERLFPRP